METPRIMHLRVNYDYSLRYGIQLAVETATEAGIENYTLMIGFIPAPVNEEGENMPYGTIAEGVIEIIITEVLK